jgi:hypothetical protein
MVERFIVALVLVTVAVVVALVAERRRRQRTGAPGFVAPDRVERSDFARPDAPWLLAVFTSSTCETCAEVAATAVSFTDADVVVHELEAKKDRAAHERYGINAVPLVVLADGDGSVRFHLFGPVRAEEIAEALAAARAEEDV